jgi:hypothetical protein
VFVLESSQFAKVDGDSTRINPKRRLDGGLINEERGAGDPVGAGADESALLRRIKAGRISICKLRP